MANEFPQALTIAGADSDGSAGMEADLTTMFTLGVHGMCVLTAAVSGNSYGIDAAHNMPTDFIAQQFKTLAADFKIRAAKTGMLSDSELIRTVATNVKAGTFGPLVLDPVIITKHGAMLLEESAYETLRQELIPLATVITPNFFEAQKLAEMDITTDADMVTAAHKLQDMGAKNVLVKGAHHDGDQDEVRDFALLADGTSFWLSAPYVATEHINGTGDTLSAAITAELAKGNGMADAFRIAKQYTYEAIADPIAVGHKFGPINHWAPKMTRLK
ncbi:bifunctional hydroxymethylpyrimidine kinase/phosphomethylpyrimidine kinase [Schleiferilactobacillus shenzhenensis]|uniref:Hydroxymethylpyrimidine/phosphomethylpyrimidine kinase n=1 Tax=Schleiferilactobacillus shenzhenensis LY-73 TaxID=1231336 RepID=U4TVJ1_9LACO|nr:bifunctional hydroxymethylpyrimidine kinase/phosphomethylpyrimidine kinase [Schleiferilactobacillus shenzhenensis]ERL65407.1 ThiD [Schleiferilactobacillus shenzhenensis LY-73]